MSGEGREEGVSGEGRGCEGVSGEGRGCEGEWGGKRV